jgi:flagellar motor switch protein FliN/FliY
MADTGAPISQEELDNLLKQLGMAGQSPQEQPQGNIDEEVLRIMEEQAKEETPSIAQSSPLVSLDDTPPAAPGEEVHLAQFQDFRDRSGSVVPQVDLERQTNLERLLDITLIVSAELGRKLMSIKEILELGEGEVVPLNTVAGDTIDLLVNNKRFAKGEVVIIGDNLGIRITDLISPADRLKNL